MYICIYAPQVCDESQCTEVHTWSLAAHMYAYVDTVQRITVYRGAGMVAGVTQMYTHTYIHTYIDGCNES